MTASLTDEMSVCLSTAVLSTALPLINGWAGMGNRVRSSSGTLKDAIVSELDLEAKDGVVGERGDILSRCLLRPPL